ncbi:MAG: SDR family oxidoreductase [Polyangiales bacterium]
MSATAVVTGAGRGIGRAIALALAGRGLDVALLGRTEPDLDDVARAILLAYPARRVLALPCDVASSAAVEVAASRVVDALGVPLVVVNNAGVVHRASIEETSEDAWDHVVDVNLKGPFLVTRAFRPAMRGKREGRFVQISSISGTLGTPRLSAYCASKWGLIGFTKSLAEELRESGLQALTVVPGSVDTEMLKGSGFPPQMTADDVATVVVYAALDAPAAMNGASLDVFGP